ncbi:hypothetical protein AB1K18_22825 [Peribacillus simplex]|uniref:hypothetical protein n=1 Tax=Peribacillus simplex TaxID=1478 RepID=UPI003B8E7E57
MFTVDIERTHCRKKDCINSECVFLNDGRFSFYRKPNLLLQLDSLYKYDYLSSMIMVLKKNLNLYIIINFQEKYYRTDFDRYLAQFPEKFLIYKHGKLNNQVSNYYMKNDVLIVKIESINLQELINNYLFDIACNNSLVGFWIGENVPCFSMDTSKELMMDLAADSFFISFSWDGEEIQIFDNRGLLTKETIRKELKSIGININKDENVEYDCCDISC